MERLRPHLWASAEEGLSGRVRTRAYLLAAGGQSVLLYNARRARWLEEVEALGGITHQLLSHRHEAGPNLAILRERFGSSLVADAKEADRIARFANVDVIVDGTVPVGPITALLSPGHTEGGLCFLHDSAHGRYLFTGDVLYVAGHALETLVVACDGGDANTLARTLRALKPLRPDWVFSSAFVGERSFMDVRGGVWDAEIARNLRRLEGD